MRNYLFLTAALAAVSFVSCKEQPVTISQTEKGETTTYVTTPETPDEKKYLVEELSGVKCVNCPEGSEMLHDFNANGAFQGKLVIASLHAGTLTDMIKGKEVNSVQDFKTDIGETILTNIFGGDPGKPCASFDRLPIGAGQAPNNLMGYKSNWETMLGKAKEAAGDNPPVNIAITSEYNNESGSYDISVKVSYTRALEGRQAICLYLLENGIVDAQQYPKAPEYRETEFEHLFRTSITSYNGLEILSDIPTKEAGRVLIQKFNLKINTADAKQSFWKPENMELVAFLYKVGVPTDKRVYQAASVPLEQ